MARVASLHCLGVLVLDELQNLSEAKSGGHRKMLNFFVGLINTIGLPVVLVGTYKAWSVLSGEFRQMRRGTGQGDLVWNPMKENETWQFFLESLWRYQYVLKPCPLTPELSHALYYETQGITDFAIKVYMLAQIRAITTGREQVTEAIIRSVAKDCLCLATPVLSALKTGDKVELQKYEDVHVIDIEPYIQATKDCLPAENPVSSLPKTQSASVPALENKRSKKAKVAADHEGSLPAIVAQGASQGMAAYEAVQKAGYIKFGTEYSAELEENSG